jgi:hypothetical protein
MSHSRFLRCMPLLLLTVMAAPITARGSLQGGDTPVGTWSRVVSAESSMREVIEIGQDGTYTSGLCGTLGGGWCLKNEATASRQGTYRLRGPELTVSRGFELMLKSANEWLPRTAEAEQAYGWRVVPGRPDDPPRPTSRPPLRQLRLTDAQGRELLFNEMPDEHRPRWQKRADR